MRVRRSASLAGFSFCSPSFWAMKASTGFRTHLLDAGSLRAGTGGRAGLRNDHQSGVWLNVDGPVLGHAPPPAIHASIAAISASASFGPGGIARSPVLRSA